jgi:hypothetical protein
MRTKKVTRYYCDFCSKSKATKVSMARHESVCYFNPTRCCVTCGQENHAGQLPQTNVAENRDRLDKFGFDVDRLYEAIKCPTCVLAAVLQENKATNAAGDDYIYFDHNAEKEKWDAEKYAL